MKGLELSERYFNEICSPMVEEKFPEYSRRIASGLVGDGSECFGFDDEISRDHDWGPAVCLWLTEQDYSAVGTRLKQELARLPKDFAGFPARKESESTADRTGVFAIGSFYKRFIGFDRLPENLKEWRILPEENLAAATNGKVFRDALGEFTAFRAGLQAFYPDDVRLKKIASRCMTIAQAGQYNYQRCMRHGEHVAAAYAEAQFAYNVISMVFLLNRRYKPFYKWMHRAVRGLPVLGLQTYDLLSQLVGNGDENSRCPGIKTKIGLIEDICRSLVEELNNEGLSDSGSSFLLDHGPLVHMKIQDDYLREQNVWLE